MLALIDLLNAGLLKLPIFFFFKKAVYVKCSKCSTIKQGVPVCG